MTLTGVSSGLCEVTVTDTANNISAPYNIVVDAFVSFSLTLRYETTTSYTEYYELMGFNIETQAWETVRSRTYFPRTSYSAPYYTATTLTTFPGSKPISAYSKIRLKAYDSSSSSIRDSYKNFSAVYNFGNGHSGTLDSTTKSLDEIVTAYP